MNKAKEKRLKKEKENNYVNKTNYIKWKWYTDDIWGHEGSPQAKKKDKLYTGSSIFLPLPEQAI